MIRVAMWSCVALCAVGALVACDDEPTGPKPGEEFTLAVGEKATLEAVGATVRFVGVPADSRCPSQVECVWAGDGAVVLAIRPLVSGEAEDTLHTHPDGKRAVALSRYELTLLQLDPYPEAAFGKIPPEDYRATLALYERLQTQP